MTGRPWERGSAKSYPFGEKAETALIRLRSAACDTPSASPATSGQAGDGRQMYGKVLEQELRFVHARCAIIAIRECRTVGEVLGVLEDAMTEIGQRDLSTDAVRAHLGPEVLSEPLDGGVHG